MGLNAFVYTVTVVFGLGFTWQEALAMVFLCGVVNIHDHGDQAPQIHHQGHPRKPAETPSAAASASLWPISAC